METIRQSCFMLTAVLVLLFTFSCHQKDLNTITRNQQRTITTAATASTPGINYYVDASSTSPTQDGSISAPWKTIGQVYSNMDRFKPGDNINFKRGQRFKGSLNIYCSGTSSAPITFTTYGSGDAPVFQYNIAAAETIPIQRRAIIYAGAGISYITIDGIKFTDTTKTTSNIHTSTTANVGYAIDFDGSSTTGCNGIILKNLDISLVGIGIEIKGNNNTVSNCKIYDLGGVKNVSGSEGENNYGANGVVIGGSNNLVSNNEFRELWRTDLYFGYDGGAVEMYGAVGGQTSNNRILYNTSVNCNGFMEAGSSNNNDVAANNVVAYNLLINNAGRVFTLHNGGDGFSGNISNLQLYNNDVIETVNQLDNSTVLLWSSASSTTNLITMKNNIFWLTTNVNIARDSYFSGSQLVHTNNIYRLSGGSLNFTLGSTELNLSGTTTAVFTSTRNANPANWDYNLASSSPAIDKGTKLGLTLDLKGKVVFSSMAPDAGAIESTSP